MATDRRKLDANQRYLDKLDRVTFRVHKDGSDDITVEQIREAAELSGMSVNSWIIYSLRQSIDQY